MGLIRSAPAGEAAPVEAWFRGIQSSGESLTASDVVMSWRRALEPVGARRADGSIEPLAPEVDAAATKPWQRDAWVELVVKADRAGFYAEVSEDGHVATIRDRDSASALLDGRSRQDGTVGALLEGQLARSRRPGSRKRVAGLTAARALAVMALRDRGFGFAPACDLVWGWDPDDIHASGRLAELEGRGRSPSDYRTEVRRTLERLGVE